MNNINNNSISDFDQPILSPITIGTHNGTFHCDECLAIYMLLQIYPNAKIIRTRDENILKQLTVIVDVGGEYNPLKNQYDHHQRGFNQTLDENHKMKLSSAGLIYKHFGKKVINLLCQNYKNSKVSRNEKVSSLPELSDQNIEVIYQKVYSSFIESTDGIDNGVSQYSSEIIPLYKNSTDLSSRISWLNPSWNEENSDEISYSQFLKAIKLTGEDFDHFVFHYYANWFPARNIVKNAMSERFQIHNSGHILVLKEYTIWKSHLFDLEMEENISEYNQIYYVLYCDTSGDWRIQCVPIHENSFVSRFPLPEFWRGLRNDELSNKIQIENCIFVHATGFIGGAKTFEAVKKMAIKALEKI